MLLQLRLFAGAEAAFDRRVAAPGKLFEAFGAAKLSNVTGFRRGTDVWCYAESRGSGAAREGEGFDRLSANGSWQRWLWLLDDVVDASTGPGGFVRYRHVFRSDGPTLPSRAERGMFVLVVDPERVADYDARHAEPWPEMVEALADSGFRNYSGFRNGAQVAYYGEFHPDMATAVATIGTTDTNKRWGESFEGIITSITDEEGNLFVVREVFHLP